jgi:hypothetical protein
VKAKAFRHLWGIEGAVELALPKIKAAGYDGVEFSILKTLRNPFISTFIREHKMEFVAQIHTTGDTVSGHVASFAEQVGLCLPLNPVLINSQSGSDRWSFDEKKRFLDAVLKLQQSLPVPVAHETHRGRITYNPWDTDRLLAEFDEMRLCCDYSHWVCVGERLIDSETDILRRCADRCIHLHARVGYEQGPQVPDPRAPEFRVHLEAHEKWWEMIWRSQHKRMNSYTTFTPEFGPPPYLHTMPYSKEPVAGLWAICDWMRDRQLEKIHNMFDPGLSAK